MGNTLFAALCALVAAMLAANSALAFERPQIPFEPEGINCWEARQAPVIDGLLNDPAWEAAEWTADFSDIRGGEWPVPRYRTRAKLLWDTECLYIGAELEEPQLQASFTRRDSYIYQLDNDFEVFIDPDGDGHNYFELELNALNTQWDLLIVKPYRDGGPALTGFDLAGLKSAVHLDGTLNDPSDVDRGWSLEIAIPWAALKDAAGTACPPVPAGDHSTWRMNFSRVEWRFKAEGGRYVKELDPATGKPYSEDNWVWSPQGLIAMHYPERWGFVVFCDSDGPGMDRAAEAQMIQIREVFYELYYAEKDYFEQHLAYTDDLAALGFDPDAAFSRVARPLDASGFELFASPMQFFARMRWPNTSFSSSFMAIDQDGRYTEFMEPCG